MFAGSQEWPYWLCSSGLPAFPLTRALFVPHTFLQTPGPSWSGWLAGAAAWAEGHMLGVAYRPPRLRGASPGGLLPASLEPGKVFGWKSFLLPSRPSYKPLLTRAQERPGVEASTARESPLQKVG